MSPNFKRILSSVGLATLLFCVLTLNFGCARLLSALGGSSGTPAPTGSPTPDTGSPTGGNGYFPNVDGYSWVYKTYLPNGTSGETVASFEGSGSINGSFFQRMRRVTTVNNVASTQDSYYWVTNDWVKDYGDGQLSSEAQYTFLSLPLSNGKVWDVQPANVIDAIAETGTVTVPAGSYTTNVYRITIRQNSQPFFHLWLARNIGIVKYEWPANQGGGLVTYELTGYSFAP